jgi:hypothetical protein
VSRVAAIGEAQRLAGYALAGADVRPAADADGVRAEWAALAEDVGLLILTPAARRALGRRLSERPRLIWAVVPD